MTTLMNAKKTKEPNTQTKSANVLIWLAVVIVVIIGMIGYGMIPQSLSAFSSLYMTIVCIVAIGIASMTAEGKTLRQTITDATNELRFITWPQSQEVWHITAIVVISLALSTLALAVIDGLISFVFGYFIGQ